LWKSGSLCLNFFFPFKVSWEGIRQTKEKGEGEGGRGGREKKEKKEEEEEDEEEEEGG
jgi:hypothetical protein